MLGPITSQEAKVLNNTLLLHLSQNQELPFFLIETYYQLDYAKLVDKKTPRPINMDSHVPETSKTVPISAKEDQSTKTTDQNQDLDELIKDYLLCLDKYSTTQSNAGTAFSRVSC